MFDLLLDLQRYRDARAGDGLDHMQSDELARRCREPAELWVLARRAHLPSPPPQNLPRVVSS